MFGLPGGEILAFIEAARKVGIEFLLTRHEATASLMAEATGHLRRRPGVCVSTLGPGAMNLALGVANAYLDRSPVIAITAATAEAASPLATHQNLDLNAIFRPMTKATLTLDGVDTAAKVRRAYRAAVEPRMGPVHLALPNDVAVREETQTQDPAGITLDPDPPPPPAEGAIERMAAEIRKARRPVVILGLDLDPFSMTAEVRRFLDHLNVPVFVAPKCKGILSEDHPLFMGVCAGVACDAVILRFFDRADLLIGLGFEPVESEKLWHHTLDLVSIGPLSIAEGSFAPRLELVGDLHDTLAALQEMSFGPFDWTDEEIRAYREEMERTLRPAHAPTQGISPLEMVRCLRDLCPPDTIATTDVGSVKFITTQAWRTYEPLTFLESNGLSTMGYALPAAMAAKIEFPDRPVLCTVGDGGFGMSFADLETCVREGINFVTVVFNDNALSLIKVIQGRKELPEYGVDFGPVDFAAAAAALGAWSRRVQSLGELEDAFKEGLRQDRPSVIDAVIDPTEYTAHAAPPRKAG